MACPRLPPELWALIAAHSGTAAMAGVNRLLRTTWLERNGWTGTVFAAMLARRRGVPAAIDLHDALTANFRARAKNRTVPLDVVISEACANHRDFAALGAKLNLGTAGGKISLWRNMVRVVRPDRKTRSRPRTIRWPGVGAGAWTTLAADLARVIDGETDGKVITVAAGRVRAGQWRPNAEVVVYRSTMGDSAVGWAIPDNRPKSLPRSFVWLCAGRTDGRDIVIAARNQAHPHAALIQSPMRASRADVFDWTRTRLT